jgi:hypothetical protein
MRSHAPLSLLFAGLTALAHPATGFAQSSESSSIRFVPARQNQLAAVEVTGKITRASPDELRVALSEAIKRPSAFHNGGAPLIPVRLNSPGGDIVAAMKMGELIRQAGASTWVVPNATCASACILVLAGGVERIAFDDAKLGLHRPYMPADRFAGLTRQQAEASYQQMEVAVADYLRRMGASQQLFDRMLVVPSNKVNWLSEAEATKLRLLGTDPLLSKTGARERRSRDVTRV